MKVKLKLKDNIVTTQQVNDIPEGYRGVITSYQIPGWYGVKLENNQTVYLHEDHIKLNYRD